MRDLIKRLYLLKGRIGLVGNSEQCKVSFCLPWRGTRLAFLDLSFNVEELKRNTPKQFLEMLKIKIHHLEMSWEDHVQNIDKEDPSA